MDNAEIITVNVTFEIESSWNIPDSVLSEKLDKFYSELAESLQKISGIQEKTIKESLYNDESIKIKFTD